MSVSLSPSSPSHTRLGPKALVLFLAGTASVIVGAPLALWVVGLVSPETVAGDVWRGLTAVAGAWIGGGANQAAMKDVFQIPADIFGAMVAVVVVVANVWMAILLYLAGRSRDIDARRRVDTSAVDALRDEVARFEKENSRNPDLRDLMLICAVGFGLMGLSHLLGGPLARWIEAVAPHLGV